MESTCTSEKHIVNEVSGGIASVVKQWKETKGNSEWFILSKTTDETIQWMAYFSHLLKDDFAVNVRFESCKEQEHNRVGAVSFRLFAVVEENLKIWTEEASVLKSGEVRKCYFSKKFQEVPEERPIHIRVHVQWNKLDQLPITEDMLVKDVTWIVCRWKLQGWRTVSPTSSCWSLFSEPFGPRNVWRIVLKNRLNGNDRERVVWIKLEHVPPFIRLSNLTYTLSVFDKELNQDNCSLCEWKIPQTMENNSFDLLDLKVTILIKRKKM